jgi:acetyl-CoA carboxylase biotin carboxyl carrier protein
VADDSRNKPGPFDVHTIEHLVGLMSRHDISEMDLCAGEQRIRLRRGTRVPTASVPLTVPPVATTPTATIPAPPAGEAGPARAALVEIKSPTIGTYYAQEKEGAPPYVTVGARVTPTSVVGLIEAMKLYNEIQAGCSGVIAEIVVKNAQPVEFNQVLFRVDPTR